MRCSDCAKYQTRDCQANPGGTDWDMAENYSCFQLKAETPPQAPAAAGSYSSQYPPGSRPYYVTREETSSAWWLMPIFLGWVGGVVSYFVVRDKDPGKARNLLITGILISAVPFIFWLFFFSCAVFAGL